MIGSSAFNWFGLDCTNLIGNAIVPSKVTFQIEFPAFNE